MTNGAVLTPEAQALARLTAYDPSEELGFDEALDPTPPPPAYQPALDGEAEPAPVPPASAPVATESTEPAIAVPNEADTDDEDDEIDPRTVKTRVGIVNSPYAKGLLIAGGIGLVFGFVAVFLYGVTSRPNTPPPVPTATATPTTGTDDSAALDETSKYKTEAALTTQKTALNQVAPKPSPSPAQSPAAAEPTALKPALAPPVSSIPLSPLTPALPLAGVNTTPVTPPDPVQQWQTAARLGSYGRLAPGSSSYTPATPTVPVVPVVPSAPVAYTPPVVPMTSSSGALPLTQLRSSSSTPGLRDQPLAAVLVGSTVPAQLATAIVMAGDNTTPVAPDSPSATRYLVRLTGDLKDANGQVALPSGSQVVVVARSFSQQSGSAEFVATSVIVNQKEYAAPKDALVVRATNGGLLAFNKQGGGGGLFQSVLPAFFAGVSQAGQVLNQPSSSATVSGGSVSATTTSSNPSPLAGFAQGFGQNLSQSLQQQAQAANQAAASRPASWSLGAGTGVMVFVNSSFQL